MTAREFDQERRRAYADALRSIADGPTIDALCRYDREPVALHDRQDTFACAEKLAHREPIR